MTLPSADRLRLFDIDGPARIEVAGVVSGVSNSAEESRERPSREEREESVGLFDFAADFLYAERSMADTAGMATPLTNLPDGTAIPSSFSLSSSAAGRLLLERPVATVLLRIDGFE